ncbi:hypothetical protein ACJD0Z_10200 [Flavobacteriaceae bacterium M23B6Z8]
MKNHLITIFFSFFLFITSNVRAQNSAPEPEPQKMEDRIEEQVEKLGQKLELDNLQKALLKANLKEYNLKAIELIQNNESREELRQAIQALRNKQKEDLAVFLDEEQIAAFEAFQKKERKRNRSTVRRQRQRYR